MKELRMLCAEDEQSRSCWMTAFRIFKVILQCLHRSTANVISSILFVPSNLLIVCNTSNLMAFIHYYVPFCSMGSYCTRITRFLNKGKLYFHTFQLLW